MDHDRHRKWHRRARTVTIAAWCVVAAFLLAAHAPRSPISPPKRVRVWTATVLPEFWGFFTRSPSEEKIFLYEERNLELEHVNPADVGNPLLGIARKRRWYAVELGMLFARIPEDAWTKCKGLEACDLSDAVTVESPLQRPNICGTHVFEKRKLAPWSWARQQPGLKLSGQAAKVNVQC